MRWTWIYLVISCSIAFPRQNLIVEARTEVTNENIRDAMHSLMQIIRGTEDKLERHEFRERQLGEHLKKALVNVEKRQRSLEPIKGTLSRLDERLASVETILIQKDERERIQMQKTTNAIEEIGNNLQAWMTKMEKMMVDSKPVQESVPANELPKFDTLSKQDLQELQEAIGTKVDSVLTKEENVLTKIDSIVSKMNKLDGDIVKVQEESKNIKELNEKSIKDLNLVDEQLKNSEQLLVKYENHLAELNNRVLPTNVEPAKDDWHSNFYTALDVQQSQLSKILNNIKVIDSKIQKIPEATDISANQNTTMEILQEMRHEIGSKTDKSLFKLSTRLSDIEKKLEENQDELTKTITDIGELSENGMLDIAKSNEQLRNEVQALAKVEKVMIQTADNVMDTKRRIEYGVHQILLEVGDLVKLQSKDLNATLNSRFDNIELTILDNQIGALANLSSKLEEEMSQVWRQIGIMSQELTASTAALDKLQEQTENYVNGSLSTMNNMKGKVGQITGSMAEVDSNLNYLLGRLSLVTQEFNQIKIGLGNALDNIRSSFKTVQEKISDKGPGPHQIKDEQQTLK